MGSVGHDTEKQVSSHASGQSENYLIQSFMYTAFDPEIHPLGIYFKEIIVDGNN